ncbi:PAM68 family protein [Spirulina sp. CS-785/01]|uniref:PAM68 family protein n=1 Tax=Spirulina sp. CS-785/01 TaxID=3021716 RepID=UPI00232FD0E4|nr:PAM68 family protein [Spirulina sp. CS-785/01]MDB9315536.1 PAM68 family protein [Spirulina sp. CS-785/01]
MASDSKRVGKDSPQDQENRLPFEPRRKRKKAAKSAPTPETPTPQQSAQEAASLNAIPEAVSRRMVRRMALFCGGPTGLGLVSFFIFYWVKTQGIVDLPNELVFYATLGLFGLGVGGLSYGILSTSWDEHRPGGWIGFQEFRTNAGRLWQSWQAARRAAREAKGN